MDELELKDKTNQEAVDTETPLDKMFGSCLLTRC